MTAAPADPKQLALTLCAMHGRKPDALIEILHDLQDEIGWIPKEALPVIADELNISRADIHGVVTFYEDFRDGPPGKHIVKLCRAEACQSMGSDKLADDVRALTRTNFGDTSPDGSITLDAVYCLGNCALAPSATVNGQIVGRADVAAIKKLLGK